jgi:CRISPR/Cas system CMR subunit Cmr4 (Cas7 group RAMP superfamily)
MINYEVITNYTRKTYKITKYILHSNDILKVYYPISVYLGVFNYCTIPMVSTRMKYAISLIGFRDLEPLLRLIQLPTVKKVLQRYHYHLSATRSVRNASHLTVEEVLVLWSKTAIPTTTANNPIEKLENIHSRLYLTTNVVDIIFDFLHLF